MKTDHRQTSRRIAKSLLKIAGLVFVAALLVFLYRSEVWGSHVGQEVEQALDRFYKGYNEQQWEAIRELYDSEFEKRVNWDTWSEKLQAHRASSGQYQSRTQTGRSSGSYVGFGGQWSNVSVRFRVEYEDATTMEEFLLRVEENMASRIRDHSIDVTPVPTQN